MAGGHWCTRSPHPSKRSTCAGGRWECVACRRPSGGHPCCSPASALRGTAVGCQSGLPASGGGGEPEAPSPCSGMAPLAKGPPVFGACSRSRESAAPEEAWDQRPRLLWGWRVRWGWSSLLLWRHSQAPPGLLAPQSSDTPSLLQNPSPQSCRGGGEPLWSRPLTERGHMQPTQTPETALLRHCPDQPHPHWSLGCSTSPSVLQGGACSGWSLPPAGGRSRRTGHSRHLPQRALTLPKRPLGWRRPPPAQQGAVDSPASELV